MHAAFHPFPPGSSEFAAWTLECQRQILVFQPGKPQCKRLAYSKRDITILKHRLGLILWRLSIFYDCPYNLLISIDVVMLFLRATTTLTSTWTTTSRTSTSSTVLPSNLRFPSINLIEHWEYWEGFVWPWAWTAGIPTNLVFCCFWKCDMYEATTSTWTSTGADLRGFSMDILIHFGRAFDIYYVMQQKGYWNSRALIAMDFHAHLEVGGDYFSTPILKFGYVPSRETWDS